MLLWPRLWILDGMAADVVDAIISIHPEHADSILAGRKTIELRRRIPALPLGTRLWIYATRPTGAVTGIATIQDIARGRPSTIWKTHRNGTGVDHASFQAYFSGAQEAVAIILAEPRRVVPITREQLREIRRSFHPPQVLLWLTTAETTALRVLADEWTPSA
jgi:predicted transcriptional regulator